MSIEEEVELRDLVAQTLESNGTLAKIKAQLRASIILALDEDDKISSQPLMNNKVSNYLETEEGKAMFCVVSEFLEFFELNLTLSVYQSETYCDSKYKYEGRQKLIEKLGLENTSHTAPLLFQLIKITQTKSKSIEINLNIRDEYDEEKSASVDTESDSIVKTASNSISTEAQEFNKSLELRNIAERKFNTTFDLTSPTVNLLKASTGEIHDIKKLSQPLNETFVNTFNEKNKNADDYSNASSLDEESVSSASLESSNKVPEAMTNGFQEESVLKDVPLDKPKISSPKSDKIKTKNSLCSLTDLPPLQLGKSRVNVILPSLYSKESKDKSNSREYDKLFDLNVEYEEDFMCSGDDLSLKSDSSKINLLDELLAANKSMNSHKSKGLLKKDSKQKSPNMKMSESNKSLFKPLGDSQASKENGGELNHANGADVLENTPQ